MSGNVIPLNGLKIAPRGAPKSKMDTLLITPDAVSRWKAPDFQRPLKVNAKVKAMAEYLRNEQGGVIEGVITLGIHKGDWFLVDGQHRIEAFKMSELAEGLCDVRIMQFDSMADMAEEFARLNDHIVRMTADDKLRALEKSVPALKLLREKCRFIGYGNLRRTPSSPVVSMSSVLRMWASSASDSPGHSKAVVDQARAMTDEEAKEAVDFLTTLHTAWGSDPEYYRLWAAVNLVCLAWLWRRTVTGQHSIKSSRFTREMFIKGCMQLSTDKRFLDWLVNRSATRDRSPCYRMIRSLFVQRFAQEGCGKVLFPAPVWVNHASGGRGGL